MSIGSTSRNHHWIPQCYLKGFSRSRSKNAKLFVVDAIGRKTFNTVPRNIASARDFNRIEIDGVSPDQIESDFSHFEGNVDRALQRVIESRQLGNTEDHNLILNLIALLSARNPRTRENSRQFQEKVIKQMMGLTVAKKERYEASYKQAIEAGFLTSHDDIAYETIRDFVKNDQYTIEVPTTRHIEQELRLVDTILPLLGERNWLLLRAPANTSGFVTSDHPVVLQWSSHRERGFFNSPGFALRDTEVIFPISNELAMIGSFEVNNEVIDANIKVMAVINGAIIAHSNRQVYARDDRFQYSLSRDVIRWGADVLKDLASPSVSSL